ncbi:hypothetical protein E4U42_001678 [Claviceps africana]|uniref:tripeptidyl-peptidase II n=1 Tax=Claviceps africana TaxID=83212 RepID=A0A8K0J9M6_9HYPO|nr:hypothetical protein E4U42_001678 [Claviceps africana]
MKNALVLLAGLAAAGLSMPSVSHVLHEKRDLNAPTRWTKRQVANSDHNVSVRIALKQENLDKGMDLVMEVSDPDSPKYGKHYKADQVTDLFAPKQEAIDAVNNWLVKSGVPAQNINLSKSRGWIMFDSTVEKLQSLVKADYHVYEHLQSRSDHIGTDEYRLPADIAPLVDFILPGTTFTEFRKRTGKGGPVPRATIERFVPFSQDQAAEFAVHFNGTSACDKYVTPQCIKAIYNITEATSHNPSNSLGIFEALDDVYAQEDLDAFYKLTAPNIPAGTGPILDLINGATAPNSPDNAGPESSLDFQMAIPIVYPQTTTLFQVNTQVDPFFALFDAIDGGFCNKDPQKLKNGMCDVFDPTNVISISYGGTEDQYTAKELTRQCNEFMKLALLGISVIVASGDVGVASQEGLCLGPHHDVFVAMNPAACPYVTAVGSTTLPKGSHVGHAEIATTSFSSSGGFSNMFATPPWQKKAVDNYLLRHNPNYFSYNSTGNIVPNNTAGIYNRGGRAYPDLSALGDNGVVVVGGQAGRIGGTSMAAPIVAAIFNRINEERMNLGKGPVGHINPALYKAYDTKMQDPIFRDVTKGDQRLGGPYSQRYPSLCGNNGFSAVEGFDPVTGLGTPRYPQMLDYFIHL